MSEKDEKDESDLQKDNEKDSLSPYPKAIKKNNRMFPFGYDQDPEDESMLIPDIEAVAALDVIIDYINNKAITYREAAEILSHDSGRSITEQGLHYLIKTGTHPVFNRG